MSADETMESGQLPPQVEEAIEQYLARIAAGDRPDLDRALDDVDAEHRTLFRVEVLTAQVLWFEGEGDEARVNEIYARCADDAERGHVRAAVAGAHSAVTCTPTALTTGDRISDRYELIGELGRGGIGVVYEAWDPVLERNVAIKAVRVDPGRDVAALTENLLEESKTLAGLDEANVVTVHDILRDDDRVCVVLALVDGLSLEQVVERLAARDPSDPRSRLAALREVLGEEPQGGPLTERSWYRAVAAIVARLAGSLEAAHAEGVLHRDIKPQNVILRPDGEPVLLDFGLAHRLGAKEGERFSGTPEYLAPEQLETYSIGQDRRTDVYALGLVLYELLALKRAFPRREDEKLEELFARIIHRRFDSLRSVDPGVPPVLERIVACAIAKDPDARYEGAGQFAEDLERWLARRAPRYAPVAWHQRARLFTRRVGPAVATLVMVAVLGVAGKKVYDWFGLDSQRPFEFIAVGDDGRRSLDFHGEDPVRAGDILGVRFRGERRQAVFGVSYFEGEDHVERVRPLPVLVDGAASEDGWLNWLEPGEHLVAVARASGDNAREGMMLFVCEDDCIDVVNEWMGSVEETIAGTSVPGMPRTDAEELFRRVYIKKGRGTSLDPDDLRQEDWGRPAADGEKVAKGIRRWAALYPVEP